MKKIFSLLAFLSLCTLSNLSAAATTPVREMNIDPNGVYQEGEVDPNACYQSGPCVCYCPVTRFRPEYYCETKCVEEPYTVEKKCCRYVDQNYTKKCCRYVDQPYEKQCCRMVPEYYTKTCCRMVPEYYEKQYCRNVPEYYTKTCSRKVPEYYEEQYCRKVPEYYTTCETHYRTKHVKEQKCCYKPYTCVEQFCGCPAPQQNAQMATRNPESLRDGSIALAQSDLASTIKAEIVAQNLLINNESVDVFSENGNIRLTGNVASEAKRSQIGSFVSGMQGVKHVSNEIKIDKSLNTK